METGAEQGMWTFGRYKAWMEKRTQWYGPGAVAGGGEELADSGAGVEGRLPAMGKPASKPRTLPPPGPAAGGRLEIRPVEGGLGKLLKKFEDG